MATTLWGLLVVYGLVIMVVALLIAFARRTRQPSAEVSSDLARRRFWRSALILGAFLAIARVAALWFLAYREWTRTQSLSSLPLILLLYPEGLAFPQDQGWRPGSLLLLSAALVASSLAAVLAVATGLALLRGFETQLRL